MFNKAFSMKQAPTTTHVRETKSTVALRKGCARSALAHGMATPSLIVPRAAAAEPLLEISKKPACTMTMSVEEEDECGALTSWDGPPNAQETQAWADWMARHLSCKLVGLTARTSRAQIRTLAVNSAAVVKGRIRAHELDLVLMVEGTHLKSKDAVPITGSVRVSLKTVEKKDAINLSQVEWDSQPSAATTAQVLADLTAAADTPLESALAVHLNDILWDVEKRSMGSMDMDE